MPKSFTKRGLKDYLKLSGPATIIAIVGFLVMSNFLMPNCALSADKEVSGSGGVHKIVAELSDEQVRRLLIEELQRTGRHTEDEGTGLISKGIFSGMLARLENITGVLTIRTSIRFEKQLKRSAKKCSMTRRWVPILSSLLNQAASEKWVTRL